MQGKPQLQRKLGLWACISIVAGSVIGSSIFMKPAVMAGQLGSPILLLVVWVVAGIISIFGGMINAEVGAMIPETGGQYTYFRYMYGRFFSWMFGWASLVVINTAAIAAIAFIFSEYLGYFVDLPAFPSQTERSVAWHIPFIGNLYPLQNAGVKTVTILLILTFTVINHRSLKAGAFLQVFFTVIKIAALIFLIAGIFVFGDGNVKNFYTHSSEAHLGSWGIITGFIAATSGALAAYDGWNNLGMVGGEIRQPQRNIPRGLSWGLLICLLLYVLTTQAYLFMLPVDEMKHSSLVATDALSRVMGTGGAMVIALLIMLSTSGATNGNILPCARVSYAMARDRMFFSWVGKVDRKYHTPYGALWLQCMIACLFVVTGSFNMLADLFIFVTWIFYGFAGYGIMILRKKMPATERPYRLKAYPFIPIVFIIFALVFFIITIYNDIHNYLSGRVEVVNSFLGLGLLALGLPFYFYFNIKNRPHLSGTIRKPG